MDLESNDVKINYILESLNLPTLSKLSPNEKKYIRESEKLFIKLNNQRTAALKEYKRLKITVKFIADNLGIERQTIYNNDILNEYIKNAQINQSKEDVFDKIKSIQSKINNLENDIKLLHERDVNIEFLKYDIDELNAKLIDREKEIEDLELRNETYLMKIRQLEQEIILKKNNIYKFK